MTADPYRQRMIELAEALGFEGRAAQAFVDGRDGPYDDDENGYDHLVRLGRRMGLSESAAKAFAVGRDLSESAARSGWTAIAEPALPTAATPQQQNLTEGALEAGYRDLRDERDRLAAQLQASYQLTEADARRRAVEITNQQLEREDIPADQRPGRAAIYAREYARGIAEGLPFPERATSAATRTQAQIQESAQLTDANVDAEIAASLARILKGA